jgi:hypothetical protein
MVSETIEIVKIIAGWCQRLLQDWDLTFRWLRSLQDWVVTQADKSNKSKAQNLTVFQDSLDIIIDIAIVW